jgi:hypothetical protein
VIADGANILARAQLLHAHSIPSGSTAHNFLVSFYQPPQ